MKIRVQSFIQALVLACVLIVPAAVITSSCSTTQQERTYKTIYSVQATTVAAYDAYVSQVIAGKVATNGLPSVSRAFNKFQASTLVALDLAQHDTNAPAPINITTLSADLLNLISQFSKK